MKAVRIHTYGGPEVLQLEELALPVPGPGEILVKVRAAGVNVIRPGPRIVPSVRDARGIPGRFKS